MTRYGLLVFALSAAVTIVATPSAASAQGRYAPPPPPPGYNPPPPPQTYAAPPTLRSGFTIGAGLGMGSLSLSDDIGDIGDFGSGFFELHAGGMINPRLALLIELWGSIHSDETEDRSLTQGNAGIAIQWWATEKLWLKFGLGTSRLEENSLAFGDEIGSAEGAAALFAAGYELVHHPKWALDLQLRGTAAGYQDTADNLTASSGSLSLGFSWF